MTMSAARVDALSRDVEQLFFEYYGYTDHFNKIKEVVGRLHGPKRSEPFFWDLIYWSTGPGLLRRLITILKKYGVDLNERNDSQETCLHRIVLWDESEEPGWQSAGIQSAIRILVSAGADPALCDERGNGPLMPALCTEVEPDMISLLAELSSQSLNNRNGAGVTPLRAAIRSLNEEAIRILLTKGANPFLADDQYGNILHWVVESVEKYDSCFTEYLTEIISDFHKALRDGKRKCDGQMPLMLLCSRCFVLPVPDDVFRMLIPSKEAINDTCDEGRSCLSYVIGSHFRAEKVPRITQLVDAGAAVTSEVLNAAISGRVYDPLVVKKLLDLGAVPGIQDLKECLKRPEPDGHAAFRLLLTAITTRTLRDSFPDVACAYLLHFVQWHLPGESIDADFIIKLMRDNDLDVNYNDPEYGTLLHILCHRQRDGSVALFKRLIQEYGEKLDVDPLAKRDPAPYWMTDLDESLTTPLQIAIEMGSFEMAIALLQNYASTESLCVKKMRSGSNDRDPQYYQLIRMLKLNGIQSSLLDGKVRELQDKYKDFDLLTKPEPVKSLAELACLTLRRNFTRSDALDLVQSMHLSSKVEEYIFLKHVHEVHFPKMPAVDGIFFDGDYYDEDDDDDDDYFDDASDMIDDWGDDHYDSDVEAYFFFE